MTEKGYQEAKACGKELAEILAYIQDHGYTLSEFEKGRIVGTLETIKQCRNPA